MVYRCSFFPPAADAIVISFMIYMDPVAAGSAPDLRTHLLKIYSPWDSARISAGLPADIKFIRPAWWGPGSGCIYYVLFLCLQGLHELHFLLLVYIYIYFMSIVDTAGRKSIYIILISEPLEAVASVEAVDIKSVFAAVFIIILYIGSWASWGSRSHSR